MKKKENRKVVVAISGGVDSSVSALLLKNLGLKVIGIFMKFWQAPVDNGLIGRWNRCCTPEAEKRARKIAQILGIPFYKFNLEKEFKQEVVDYFLKELKKGRTPNPCVVCNQKIKFGLLLEKALKFGAEFLATGHYARIWPNPLDFIFSGVSPKRKKIKLLRAKDKAKDQSYFLWNLKETQLAHLIFPLGELTKKEVRKLAKKYQLPLSNLPESQELCFVKNKVSDFLKRYFSPKPGKIATAEGEIIGSHPGLYFYTLGQRKEIGLTEGPWYVLKKDQKKNLLIVTRNKEALLKKEVLVEKVNWHSKKPTFPLKVEAKIRYQHQQAPATILPDQKRKGRLRVIFAKEQFAITPGQSIVFYQKEELLGGGIIFS